MKGFVLGLLKKKRVVASLLSVVFLAVGVVNPDISSRLGADLVCSVVACDA